MDNHTFGEPVPVIPIDRSNNDTNDTEPSWTVDVIRHTKDSITGDTTAVVVGTIIINNTKLPPRRNKNKKIVWKLPSSYDTDETPRFGKQDYPRLWEIYKEEKKKRRKAAACSSSGNSSGANVDQVPQQEQQRQEEDENDEDACNDSNHDNVQNSHVGWENSLATGTANTSTNFVNGISTVTPTKNQATTTKLSIAVPPPPGFGSLLLYTGSQKQQQALQHQTMSTTATPRNIPPPPGFS